MEQITCEDLEEMYLHLYEQQKPIRSIIVIGCSNSTVEYIIKNTDEGCTIVMSQSQFDELCNQNVKSEKKVRNN